MARKITLNIQQASDRATPEQEAFLSIVRTADALMRGVAEVLKPTTLSPTQYNVLRILRGAEPDGLACQQIGDRMLTREPDITRLLDRLSARDLITRVRSTEDRRIVLTRITREGLKMIDALDEPIRQLHRQQLSHLSRQQLQRLVDDLELARAEIA